MPGLFSRIKTWVNKEVLTHTDLNAEFDNIINNFEPAQMDDYSSTVVEMQTQTDPGTQGSESQPTTLAGEIERLRFVIDRIIGKTYWYDSPDIDLAQVNLNIELPQNRIVSGRVRTSSEQPLHLVPNGAAATVTLKGATTPFVYNVDGIQYTISTDVDKTLLSLAPSANNTALVNDTTITTTGSFKYAMDGRSIYMDTAGSEIVSLVGSIAGFKWNDGTTDEYFVAYIKSITELTHVQRAWFFDSSDNPKGSVDITNNDTITLLKLTHVFANTAGALEVTYNAPIYSATQPSSPSTDDYWFDTVNDTWKKYDGATWNAANAILIGICLQDSTNCVAARSFHAPKTSFSSQGNLILNTVSNTTVTGLQRADTYISVYGNTFRFDNETLTWDITADLESGVTEAANTIYYLYMTEDGTEKISDQPPYYDEYFLKGYYHPLQTWRAIAVIANDSSSNLAPRFFHMFPQDGSTSKAIFVEENATITNAAGRGVSYNTNYGEIGVSFVSSFNTTSTTATVVTNSALSVISATRPVMIMTQGGIGLGPIFTVDGGGTSQTTISGTVYLYRDTAPDFSSETQLSQYTVGFDRGSTSETGLIYYGDGFLQYLDLDVPRGVPVYYRLKINVTVGVSGTFTVTSLRMLAYEI